MDEKVLAALVKSGEPMKSADVASAAGIDKKDADKVIKKLVAEGKVISPKRCFYSAK